MREPAAIDSVVTHSTDSAATVQPTPAPADPFEAKTCREAEAPRPTDNTFFTTGRVPYSYGLEGLPRPHLPGYDTGVMCLLLATFLFLSANFRHYSTFLKTFAQDLWKVRNRSNIFDDHTLSETRVQASFILVLCVSEGILMYSAIASHLSDTAVFMSVGICTCVAMFYYVAQIVVYKAVGFTFTSSQRAGEWLKGFRASQSLLGIGIVIPALVVLFNPGAATAMTILALGLYVIARFIFILKGFRIFYVNSFSLIYFILYLCGLEILPPLILARAAYNLSLFFD